MKRFLLTSAAMFSLAIFSNSYAQEGKSMEPQKGGKSLESVQGTQTLTPLKDLTPVPINEVTCCSKIFYRDELRGMVLIESNPLNGKFVGKKLRYSIRDAKGKIVASARYKIMKDKAGNFVVVPNSLVGKGYKLEVCVDGTKNCAVYNFDAAATADSAK